MRLLSNHQHLHETTVVYISEIIKILLYILCIIGLIGIAVGVYMTGVHLYGHRHDGLDALLHSLVIDTITILAVVEVVRTILSYLSEGRVRVSLIIDTVLIVTLNEVTKTWFEKGPHMEAFYLIVVTAVLMGLRILAIRFGPSKAEKT